MISDKFDELWVCVAVLSTDEEREREARRLNGDEWSLDGQTQPEPCQHNDDEPSDLARVHVRLVK